MTKLYKVDLMFVSDDFESGVMKHTTVIAVGKAEAIGKAVLEFSCVQSGLPLRNIDVFEQVEAV